MSWYLKGEKQPGLQQSGLGVVSVESPGGAKAATEGSSLTWLGQSQLRASVEQGRLEGKAVWHG